jgi:hypothetical protein
MRTASNSSEYRFERVKLDHIMQDLAFRREAPPRLPDFDLPSAEGTRVRASDMVGRACARDACRL